MSGETDWLALMNGSFETRMLSEMSLCDFIPLGAA